MNESPITLYVRPRCELCANARDALRAVLADSARDPHIHEVDIEQDSALHARLFAEIPAIEYRGAMLPHATTRLRIQAFFDNVDATGMNRG